MVLPAIPGPPRFLQTHTRAAVLRRELDTRVFQRALDFGEGLNSPSDRAIAAFHALYGGNVDIGLLGKLVRGPAQERARRANLIRGQHALNSIKLPQRCGDSQQNCSKKMDIRLNLFVSYCILPPPVSVGRLTLP